MSVAAIWADDWLRHLLFGEERPPISALIGKLTQTALFGHGRDTDLAHLVVVHGA